LPCLIRCRAFAYPTPRTEEISLGDRTSGNDSILIFNKIPPKIILVAIVAMIAIFFQKEKMI